MKYAITNCYKKLVIVFEKPNSYLCETPDGWPPSLYDITEYILDSTKMYWWFQKSEIIKVVDGFNSSIQLSNTALSVINKVNSFLNINNEESLNDSSAELCGNDEDDDDFCDEDDDW
jgi:hypothetical protein